MQYVYIEPEVAGGLGDHTVMDRSVHPPIVSKLHYQMEGWLGDALLESFPVFIVTEQAKQGLLASGLTGATFADAEVTTTGDFRYRGTVYLFCWGIGGQYTYLTASHLCHRNAGYG